jgi:hypothetical protein
MTGRHLYDYKTNDTVLTGEIFYHSCLRQSLFPSEFLMRSFGQSRCGDSESFDS